MILAGGPLKLKPSIPLFESKSIRANASHLFPSACRWLKNEALFRLPETLAGGYAYSIVSLPAARPAKDL